MNHLNHARTFATPLFAAALLLAGAGGALAATIHYVDVNSTYATPPFINWTTAATNIQDAVDAAVAGAATLLQLHGRAVLALDQRR